MLLAAVLLLFAAFYCFLLLFVAFCCFLLFYAAFCCFMLLFPFNGLVIQLLHQHLSS
jgi:hypothetical protein